MPNNTGLERGFFYARGLRGRICDLPPYILDNLCDAVVMMERRRAENIQQQRNYREKLWQQKNNPSS